MTFFSRDQDEQRKDNYIMPVIKQMWKSFISIFAKCACVLSSLVPIVVKKLFVAKILFFNLNWRYRKIASGVIFSIILQLSKLFFQSNVLGSKSSIFQFSSDFLRLLVFQKYFINGTAAMYGLRNSFNWLEIIGFMVLSYSVFISGFILRLVRDLLSPSYCKIY